MNFHKLDKIMDNINVHNKYLLTSIVAKRARQIVETRGVNDLQARFPDEKSISLALTDLEEGNVIVQLQEERISDVIESEMAAEATKQNAGEIATDTEKQDVGEISAEPQLQPQDVSAGK